MPGVWPAALQKSAKYTAAASIQPDAEQRADQPVGPDPADQRADQRDDPDPRGEDDDDDEGVDPECDRAGDKAGIGGRGRHPADPAVHSCRGRASLAHDLLGQAGGLACDRRTYLRARGDRAQGVAHLRALERLVHQLVQLPARGQLGGHAFEHVVPDDRLRELLRQRSRQRLVEDARRLRRLEHVVGGVFYTPPRRARSDSRGVERRRVGPRR